MAVAQPFTVANEKYNITTDSTEVYIVRNAEQDFRASTLKMEIPALFSGHIRHIWILFQLLIPFRVNHMSLLEQTIICMQL